MRIISGIYGGRKLSVPQNDDIRPTSDKIRGSIFNKLRGYGVLADARVLDLFCGTGALGLEALSNGAAYCTFVDHARVSLDLARENAAALGALEVQFVLGNAALFKGQGEPYDLVFLDAPYGRGLLVPCLENLQAVQALSAEALIVVEAEKEFSDVVPQCYAVLDERVYGDTKILILQYSGIDKSK